MRRLLLPVILTAALTEPGCPVVDAPRKGVEQGARGVGKVAEEVVGGVFGILGGERREEHRRTPSERMRVALARAADDAETAEPRELWSLPDGEIPLGRTVLVTVSELVPNPKDPSNTVTQVRNVPLRLGGTERTDHASVSIDGKLFRLQTFVSAFGREIPVDTVVVQVAKNQNLVVVHGSVSGHRGFAAFDADGLKAVCENLLSHSSAEFPIKTEQFGRRRSRLVAAPKEIRE